MSRYSALISKDSITPADSTAISLLSSLPKEKRNDCYIRIKDKLTDFVCDFIERKLL